MHGVPMSQVDDRRLFDELLKISPSGHRAAIALADSNSSPTVAMPVVITLKVGQAW